jgi:hypothetical protein
MIPIRQLVFWARRTWVCFLLRWENAAGEGNQGKKITPHQTMIAARHLPVSCQRSEARSGIYPCRVPTKVLPCSLSAIANDGEASVRGPLHYEKAVRDAIGSRACTRQITGISLEADTRWGRQ